MKRILIVEDDENIAGMISDYLEYAGYHVTLFEDGKSACEYIENNHDIDLLLTDLKVPSMDGMEICRFVRAKKVFNKLPILIMTGKSDIMTKYLGFEAGCDDHIAKPFEPMELLLKIRSLIRRMDLVEETSEVEDDTSSPQTEEDYEDMDFINAKNSELQINNKQVYLTPIELDIFIYLYNNSNRIIKSEELLNQVMSYPKGAGNPEAIRTHIKNIRKKIERSRDNPEIITHIPKKGYYFNKNKIDLVSTEKRFLSTN